MNKEHARKVLRNALLVVGFGIILWIAWSARAEVARLSVTIKPGWMVIAVLLGVALNLLQGVIFSLLLRKHGALGTTTAHADAYLMSLPGKYLPGRIWGSVYQVAAIPGAGAVRAVLLANLESTAVNTLLLVGLGVACIPSLKIGSAVLLLVMTTSLMAITLRQEIVATVLTALMHRFPRLHISISPEPAIPPSWLSATFFAVTLLALCAATSSAVVFASGQTAWNEILGMLALMFLGWTAGLLAVPVPAGVGVREASTLALWAILPTGSTRGAVIAVMLLTRVWQLVVDAVTVGLALARSAFLKHSL